MTANEDEKFCYFRYSRKQMNTFQVTPSPPAPETIIKNLLEWLTLAHGRTGSEDANQLHQQLLQLRQAPIPTAQRIKILDLLYSQTERVVNTELRTLHEISLPASRKLRQRMKLVLDLLVMLTQDYFNTLAELFDPESQDTPRSPHLSLHRAMKAIAWQIRINHLLASPPGIGSPASRPSGRCECSRRMPWQWDPWSAPPPTAWCRTWQTPFQPHCGTARCSTPP